MTEPDRGPPPVLRTVAVIPLTGPAARFEYQTLDTVSIVSTSRMGADQLVVVDLAKRSVVAKQSGFDRVHGVLVAPDITRVSSRLSRGPSKQ